LGKSRGLKTKVQKVLEKENEKNLEIFFTNNLKKVQRRGLDMKKPYSSGVASLPLRQG